MDGFPGKTKKLGQETGKNWKKRLYLVPKYSSLLRGRRKKKSN
jgi:hypothetical protein